MRPIAVLVLLAVFLPVARAGGTESTERILERLVRQAVEGPAVDDPSPTSLVADLLRTDPERLRKLLERHWEDRHLYAWDAARALEEVTELLYGRTPEGRDPAARPDGCGLWTFHGAVIVRKVYDGARWDGPFKGDDLPGFEERFGNRKLRPPPEPAAADLWTGFEAGAADDWGEAERVSCSLALGEAVRRDPAVRKKLLAAAAANKRSDLLTAALGVAGGPEAVALLSGRFRLAAPEPHHRPARFLEIAHYLARAGPEALQEALAGIESSRRSWASSLVFARYLLPGQLRRLEVADGDAARRVALASIDELVQRGSRGDRPVRELPGLLRLLVRELDRAEGADRATLRTAAKVMLGVGESFPLSGSPPTGKEPNREEGRWRGPIGGVEGLLRTLVEDLEAGRLVSLERHPDWWKPDFYLRPPPLPVKADGSRAQTDLPGPRIMTDPDPRFPVHASFERVDGGIRLTFRNVGSEAFFVSPEALRYGSMNVTLVTLEQSGEGGEKYAQLRLGLGAIPGPFAVPAARLERVEPEGAYSWVVPVPSEFGKVTTIELSLRRFPITGRAEGPVLLNIMNTWLR